jgi:hypothetical protein
MNFEKLKKKKNLGFAIFFILEIAIKNGDVHERYASSFFLVKTLALKNRTIVDEYIEEEMVMRIIADKMETPSDASLRSIMYSQQQSLLGYKTDFKKQNE